MFYIFIPETKLTRAIEFEIRWYGIYFNVFEGVDCDYLPWRMGSISIQWKFDKGLWIDRSF
jgi:hypothetical protein